MVTGGTVNQSVLSPACYVDEGAEVSDSVLLPGVTVGAGAIVRNAIIDKNVVVPPGAEIGVSPEDDLERGFVGRRRADGAGEGTGGPEAVNDSRAGQPAAAV